MMGEGLNSVSPFLSQLKTNYVMFCYRSHVITYEQSMAHAVGKISINPFCYVSTMNSVVSIGLLSLCPNMTVIL